MCKPSATPSSSVFQWLRDHFTTDLVTCTIGGNQDPFKSEPARISLILESLTYQLVVWKITSQSLGKLQYYNLFITYTACVGSATVEMVIELFNTSLHEIHDRVFTLFPSLYTGERFRCTPSMAVLYPHNTNNLLCSYCFLLNISMSYKAHSALLG